MKYVWVVLGGPREHLYGIFKTRKDARQYVKIRVGYGGLPQRYYKIRKTEVYHD